MPELPEVETVARQLDAVLVGRRVRRMRLIDPKLRRYDPGPVAGCRVSGVRRVGKQVVIELIPPRRRQTALWLCVHLRMTGRLLYSASARLPDAAARRLRAELRLDRGALFFCDTRRFGTIGLHEDPAEFAPAGADPLSPEFTWRALAELVPGSATPLKPWLLRQDKLAGIGNIYASEACFAARIDPRRAAGSLSAAEVKRLHRGLRRVLKAAIQHCGTSFSDFQDARGSMGGYVRFLKVYRREGHPCKACGAPVKRITQQQRSTFFCPACQR